MPTYTASFYTEADFVTDIKAATPAQALQRARKRSHVGASWPLRPTSPASGPQSRRPRQSSQQSRPPMFRRP